MTQSCDFWYETVHDDMTWSHEPCVLSCSHADTKRNQQINSDYTCLCHGDDQTITNHSSKFCWIYFFSKINVHSWKMIMKSFKTKKWTWTFFNFFLSTSSSIITRTHSRAWLFCIHQHYWLPFYELWAWNILFLLYTFGLFFCFQRSPFPSFFILPKINNTPIATTLTWQLMLYIWNLWIGSLDAETVWFGARW